MEVPCKDTQSIENALFIEHHVQRIITQQEEVGVVFNKTRARFYIHSLRERKERLYRKVRPYLSLQLEVPYTAAVSRPFLKDGSYSANTKSWYENSEDLHLVAGPFSRVRYSEPNLASRTQLVSQLIQRGWVPASFTEKGNPKLTVDGEPCPSLEKIGDEVGGWIAEWYILNHRESQIEGWCRRVRGGRISAQATTIGTPTFRFRHKGVVNVPRKASLFGKRMRSLFTVEAGRRMVGYDASSLELRMLAHYLNDEEYTNAVVYGRQEDGTDIHSKNTRDAGLPDRTTGKTFIYAFNYGAGAAKIGAIIGGTAAQGAAIKRRFLAKNPKLAALIKNFERAASRGYLVGLDGRRLVMRTDKRTGKPQTHKSLNTALQGGGAIVMKWAMVLMDHWIREMELDAKKVIDMHDEAQFDCDPSCADLVGRLGVLSIVTAGQLLNLNVPLDGEYQVGLNWSHTH